jgi:hypothetical protein
VAVYLPVHLEQRYLIPIVPMLCLLGGLAIQSVIASLLPRFAKSTAEARPPKTP